MNKPEQNFENSNLNEYDIDRDKHADKRDSGKDKCVCSIDIFPAAKMSGNTHEDLMISFEDSYDDYDDDSVNVSVTFNFFLFLFKTVWCVSKLVNPSDRFSIV